MDFVSNLKNFMDDNVIFNSNIADIDGFISGTGDEQAATKNLLKTIAASSLFFPPSFAAYSAAAMPFLNNINNADLNNCLGINSVLPTIKERSIQSNNNNNKNSNSSKVIFLKIFIF